MFVLICEYSKFISKYLYNAIKQDTDLEPIILNSFKDLESFVAENSDKILCAILGLVLPDAPNGEAVDICIKHKVPTIVFTSIINDDIRDTLIKKGVADYVLKDSNNNLDYVVKIVKRLYKNREIKALIVDDSSVSRKFMEDILSSHNLRVFTAINSDEALSILEKNKDIKLMLIDENMPGMRGSDLVNEVRKTYTKEQMSVIGISSYSNSILTVEFLKRGANDFILKPFNKEEFCLRVMQNLEILEMFESQKIYATTDFLTGLYNRRFLFDIGEKLLENAKRNNLPISLAIIDIDNFKYINDTYGHLFGDFVLKTLSKILKERFRAGDIVARLGGDEFCIIGIMGESSYSVFDSLRQKVSSYEFKDQDVNIKITISIGVTNKLEDKVEFMLKKADKMLYESKNLGRNVVTID
ncbi:response regulator receiver modulated diguanylate cyclase [Thermodesulfobium narugense DSM 14796]|uniref:diguanylate cyclase n=1 Tax=Thermodesulfobium narugense DSM 14796 TaxID=747365 RepID=M1E4Y2_9BACT|nr:diguanylate cyclase [Thermodesulfobium narugense]AEE14672.1 response regulator receiver modulated diguanylate cyclase [Thermodesulfobium narugense DSM 14796]